jgi:hypothetical protein
MRVQVSEAMILGEEVDEDGEPVELAAGEDIVMCTKRGFAINITSGDYLSNEMRTITNYKSRVHP